MRHLQILVLALLLTACSSGVNESPSSPALPVHPTPTSPGQVVVIAGNDRGAWYSSDGQYAVHRRLPSLGGVAAGPDGSVYFVAEIDSNGRIVRASPDGRLHLLKPTISQTDQWTLRNSRCVVRRCGTWVDKENRSVGQGGRIARGIGDGLVTPAGTLRKVRWGSGQNCTPTMGGITPDAIARRPDGDYVGPDMSCDQVYAFRVPDPVPTAPL
jgi:hypothetical protein